MAMSENINHQKFPRRSPGGFTLLELLVALSVFVVLSVMSYQGLSNMILTRDIIEEKTQELHELQMVFMLLGNDLVQAAARTVVGEGGVVDAAFRGGEQNTVWLLFTRSGRTNPRGEPRSEFQRLAWMFESGNLIRRSWQQLDASGENPYHDEIVVKGIVNLEVAFLDDKGGRFSTWPKEVEQTPVLDSLPRGVEIIVEKRGLGRIRRVFELPLAPRWS